MRKKILIVDDELLILKALSEHFDREGYITAVAGNGAECLRAVKEFRPDLVILDIIMPEMNGIEALKKLRRDPANANLPVVILTNLDTKEALVETANAGGNHYFLKINFSAEKLSDKIKKILKDS